MSTNIQQVFDTAIAFMDELRDADGAADTQNTREYKQRTLYIVNALSGLLFPYSDTCADAGSGTRSVCVPVADFDTSLDLDDYIARSVLPYGLAAHLLMDENPGAASFFQQRFEELFARLSRGIPQCFEPISDVYGGIENSQFSRWG